jgi:hypothetical protein
MNILMRDCSTFINKFLTGRNILVKYGCSIIQISMPSNQLNHTMSKFYLNSIGTKFLFEN